MDKRMNKKVGQELQDYLTFRRRGSAVRSLKGKGSYRRKPKHQNICRLGNCTYWYCSHYMSSVFYRCILRHDWYHYFHLYCSHRYIKEG